MNQVKTYVQHQVEQEKSMQNLLNDNKRLVRFSLFLSIACGLLIATVIYMLRNPIVETVILAPK